MLSANFPQCYRAGIIPESWRRYTVPDDLTVIQWITDFSMRVKQLQAIVQASQASSSRELKVTTPPALFSPLGRHAIPQGFAGIPAFW